MQQTLSRLGPIILIGGLLVVGIVGVVPGPIAASLTEWSADRLAPVLRIGAAEILAGGFFLIGGYLWYVTANTERQTHTLTGSLPPEQPRNPPAIVGESIQKDIEDAADAITIRGVPYEETTPREQLQDIVREATIQTNGQAPERQLQTGAWTDDPVAGALLSDDRGYPPRFQLYRWARPEKAYRQAVQRTVKAIDRQYNPAGNDNGEPLTESDGLFKNRINYSTTAEPIDKRQQPPQPSATEGNDD